MKIAFITHQFPNLYTTFIQNEIVELVKRGHDVSIFSIYDAFDGVVNKEVEAYNLLERTHYFNKYFRFRDRIVCSITSHT